jgi:hypothetical protein
METWTGEAELCPELGEGTGEAGLCPELDEGTGEAGLREGVDGADSAVAVGAGGRVAGALTGFGLGAGVGGKGVGVGLGSTWAVGGSAAAPGVASVPQPIIIKSAARLRAMAAREFPWDRCCFIQRGYDSTDWGECPNGIRFN